MGKLPSVLEKFRIGGIIYKCPKCGLLIEVDTERGTKNAIGFEIDGVVYGLCKGVGEFTHAGLKLISVNKLPVHPDCIWTLIPKKIVEKGKRWE